MKIKLLIVLHLLLIFSCSNSQDDKDYTEENKDLFMEKLICNTTSLKNSINIKSINNFSYIDYVNIIQNRDTIQEYPDKKEKYQFLKGTWYTIKTVLKENETMPSSINIILNTNDTGFDRSLVIRIIKNKSINDLTIIQHKDIIGGNSYEKFMDKLTDTIPAKGGSVTIKSRDIFFYVSFVGIIQQNDTIKRYFDNEIKPQVIIGDWYKIKTFFKENDLYPSSINISMSENYTDFERSLQVELPRGNSHNILNIVQKNE